MSLGDELQKLRQLHQSGALSDEEFAQAKARLLGEPQPAANADQPSALPAFSDPAYLEKQTRQWGMFLHLSIFAGYVVPFGGLIVPILIWQMKKNELPGIDAHGKNATNWIISHIIYLLLCGLLVFAVIGIPLLVALAIVSIIFPIVAALKANSGEVWKYPLAIPFFS
jgi:uncharacterized protein